jgi:hypothetical protein
MHSLPPTEHRPAIRFCIVSAGRTGSTRLRYLLDYHPLARCYGEVFGENLSGLADPGSAEEPRVRAERDRDPTGFLFRRVLVAEGASAVGFKMLYGQLHGRWPAVLQALRSDPTVHIVHLVRRDLVRRFVSEYLVGTAAVGHRYFHHEAPPDIVPVEIPVESLLADLRRVTGEMDAMRQAFSANPLHEIAYEDTIEEHGSRMRALLGFLGLAPARLWSPTRRVLPERAAAVIANMDEVEAALRGTPFETMLAGPR